MFETKPVIALYRIAGFFSLAAAIIGAFLPVLPTVPFLLLSAFCFSKSSPKMHAWLLNHQVFGQPIRDWEAKRCVAKKTKIIALSSIAISCIVTVGFLIKILWVKWLVAGLFLIGIFTVLSLNTCDDC